MITTSHHSMAQNKLSPAEEELATKLAVDVATGHYSSQTLAGLHKGPWLKVLLQIKADGYGNAAHGERQEKRLMDVTRWGEVKSGIEELNGHLGHQLVDKWALKTLLYLQELYKKQVAAAENASEAARADDIRSLEALKMMVSTCIGVFYSQE